MADLATIKRTLHIKTGVVKRLAKEELSYLTEAQDQQARIQKFIDQGKDEYDVRKQKEVLQDSLKMIPDCRKRLELATDDLMVYINGFETDPTVQETEEYQVAKQALLDAQSSLNSSVPV